MKKLLLTKWMLLLCALVVGSGSVWAEDELYYTLDGTTTVSGGSNYAEPHDVTQDEMTWSVTGNVTMNPWRIGGKNANTVDRNVYSKTAMASTISKVELSVGSITLPSVNKITLVVASDADFNTVLQTIEKTSISENSTLTFEPTGSEWAKNAYYKFVFNVTTNASNNYIHFKSAKFYKPASTEPAINAADIVLDAEETSGEIDYTISNPNGSSLTAAEKAPGYDWISDVTLDDVNNKVTFTTTENTGASREGYITLTYGTISKDVKVTQSAFVVKYNVTINSMSYGNITSDVSKAEAGAIVTLTITPADGYKLATITVTDADESEISLSGSGNTRTFTMPAKAVTISATFERDYSITYDFSFDNMGSTGWGGSYTTHKVAFSGATVDFSYASKQSGTITDIPVAKGSGDRYVSLTLTDANATLKSASFALRHWTTKTIIITMYYSTDGGENWTTTGQTHAFTSSTNGENVNLTVSSLPSGTNAVKLEGSADQQYGIASATVEIESKVTLASACTDGTYFYGTYSNDMAFVVPADLTVSAVKVADGKLVVDSYKTGDVVKANTGVMVSADTAGDHTVVLTAAAGTEINGNMLKASGDAGIDAATMNEANKKFYRLTMHEGTEIGFWWGAAGGAAFALAANKAYLAVPTGAGAREGFAFGDDETTGIRSIDNGKLTMDNVYDMQGRRVAQPQKGLYIVNGKKVVIK